MGTATGFAAYSTATTATTPRADSGPVGLRDEDRILNTMNLAPALLPATRRQQSGRRSETPSKIIDSGELIQMGGPVLDGGCQVVAIDYQSRAALSSPNTVLIRGGLRSTRMCRQ